MLRQQLMTSQTFRKRQFGEFLFTGKEKKAAGGEQAGPERRFRTKTKIHINKNRR